MNLDKIEYRCFIKVHAKEEKSSRNFSTTAKDYSECAVSTEVVDSAVSGWSRSAGVLAAAERSRKQLPKL